MEADAIRIACLDIGGTSIKSALFIENEITQFRENQTNAHLGGEHLLALCEKILISLLPFDKISISSAGQINSLDGKIIFANENIPNYTGLNPKVKFESKFNVPVFVENDVNCAAYGEYFANNLNPKDGTICLTYGTGIGGAIIINGEIYHGSSFSAGEFGHMIVRQNGIQCNCGCKGCYEVYASTTALIKLAKKYNEKILTGIDFFNLLDSGDNNCMKILDNWTDEISNGLISIIHIFNPKFLILGGGVMVRKDVVEMVKNKVLSQIMTSYRNVEIKPASLGNKAGLYGAFLISNNYF